LLSSFAAKPTIAPVDGNAIRCSNPDDRGKPISRLLRAIGGGRGPVSGVKRTGLPANGGGRICRLR